MQILKVIGLLMEYPDELLWECKEDALALICRDAPMLTDFTNGVKCSTAGAPRRCFYLSTISRQFCRCCFPRR